MLTEPPVSGAEDALGLPAPANRDFAGAGGRARIRGALAILADWSAMVGGTGFLALVLMSIVSIVKRKLGFGSLDGDVELMQVGTAVFAAAFLPLCTVRAEHLKVEFFTEGLRPSARAMLDAAGALLLAALFVLLTWRTALYAMSLREAAETTTLLAVPLWIPVALIVPSLALSSLCAVACAVGTLARRGTTPGDAS